jgi:ubiquinone/menaquinone biosynthesis C-methylase UbiE
MSRARRIWILAAVLVAIAGVGWWQREWLIARAYIATLEADRRVQELQVERVVAALRIAPGQKVADVGAGTGVFARPFARAVGPTGVVYAVDVNGELLEHLSDKASAAGLTNLRTVLAQKEDARIPELVDLIFICDTLHHIGGREQYLATLRRYLQPGGRIAIIDPDEKSPHIDALIVPSMRYNFGEFEGWMLRAGFTHVETHAFPDDYFFTVYECVTCPQGARGTVP